MTTEQPASDQSFAVGEVAIWAKPESINYGCEVTIVSPPQFARVRSTWTNRVRLVWCYEIECKNGILGPHRSTDPRVSAEAKYLRKKKPPRDDLKLVRWSECPWQPERIHG